MSTQQFEKFLSHWVTNIFNFKKILWMDGVIILLYFQQSFDGNGGIEYNEISENNDKPTYLPIFI